MTKDLDALVDKGRRSLVAARRDFQAGDYDLAVSRGYYAMFHLAVAALKMRGAEYRRHAGVIAAFREKFVAEAQFPRTSTWRWAGRSTSGRSATTATNSESRKRRRDGCWTMRRASSKRSGRTSTAAAAGEAQSFERTSEAKRS